MTHLTDRNESQTANIGFASSRWVSGGGDSAKAGQACPAPEGELCASNEL